MFQSLQLFSYTIAVCFHGLDIIIIITEFDLI